MPKRSGRRSAAQTPAPASERIKGSAKNPPGSAASAKSASKIVLSKQIVETLKKKAKEFNEANPGKKVSVATLMAVFRRGAGAYSKSHRPTITGNRPNTRTAWSYARVNKFLDKKAGKKVKKAYVQDDDLLEHGGIAGDKITIREEKQDGKVVFVKFRIRNKAKANLSRTNYLEAVDLPGPLVIKGVRKLRGKEKSDYEKKLRHLEKIGVNDIMEEAWYFDMLEVSPKYRGQGIATRILYEVFDWCRMHGVDRLYLYASSFDIWDKTISQADLKGFYRRHGFVEVANNTMVKKFPKLKAPNGRLSNLRPEQYWLVRTPEFKAWFGDWENDPKNASKVVDENGEPLVVYHGANWYQTNKFFKFKRSKVGSSTDSGGKDLAPLFYFTDSVFVALDYAGEDTENIIEVFLNIRRMKELTATPYADQKVEKEVKGLVGSYDGYLVRNTDDSLSSEGYDEKYVKRTTGWSKGDFLSDIYMLYEPSNVKLADGSNKRFDPDSDDIRYADGGLLGKYAFADRKMGGVGLSDSEMRKISYAAKKIQDAEQDEPANKLEEKLLKLIVEWVEGTDKKSADALYRNKELFDKLKKQYPAVFSPPKNTLIYRGIGLGHEFTYIEQFLKGVDLSKLVAIKGVFPGNDFYFIKKPIDYVPRLNAESWTVDMKVAMRFAENGAVLVTKASDGFYMNPAMMDAVGSQVLGSYHKNYKSDEKEVILIGKQVNNVHLMLSHEALHKFLDTLGEQERRKVKGLEDFFNKGGKINKLVAPNGKPSNLTPEQYKLVRTPEFKAWFGDWEKDPKNASKVVDENGEPLVVYHGSRTLFNVFDKSKAGAVGSSGAKYIEPVFYFTDNYFVALTYATHEDDKRRDKNDSWLAPELVRPFFLNIRRMPESKIKEWKPIKVEDAEVNRLFEIIRDLDDKVDKITKQKYGGDWKKARYDKEVERLSSESTRNYVIAQDLEGKSYTSNYDQLAKKMQGKADGVVIRNTKDAMFDDYEEGNLNDEYFKEIYMERMKKPFSGGLTSDIYIVYEPSNIKLADGTNNKFDPDSEDIRYEKGGLVAPNGKPSNLTKEQYELVRTPKFKAWFGDWENDPKNASKVVDENGEPLVVYHGTSALFNTFKEEEKGKRGGLNEKFWSFTTNKEQAKIYALDNRLYGSFSVPRIIPVFLDIKEMPSYDNEGKFYRQLEVWGGYKYIDIFQLQDWHSRGFNMGVEFKEVDGFEVKNTIEMEERDDLDKKLLIGDTYYVRNSNQIKLADGTNTTFDPDSPDIRYADGGISDDISGTVVLYHGGENLIQKELRLPIFLTPDETVSIWYANQRGGWINEFHLDFKKPLLRFADWKPILSKIGVNFEDFDEDVVWRLNNKKDYGGGILDIIYFKPFRDAALSLGYDVVVSQDAANQDTTAIVYLPLEEKSLRLIRSYRVMGDGGVVFVRNENYDTSMTKRRLPYRGVSAFAVRTDDFERFKQYAEREEGVDPSNWTVLIPSELGDYGAYAMSMEETNDYVMGLSDDKPELKPFDPEEHTMVVDVDGNLDYEDAHEIIILPVRMVSGGMTAMLVNDAVESAKFIDEIVEFALENDINPNELSATEFKIRVDPKDKYADFELRLARRELSRYFKNKPPKMYSGGQTENMQITCQKCGWSWDTKDSSPNDATVCHKCGHKNTQTDVISMNTPTFLRAMEFAKEDAKTDMDLHKVAENAAILSKDGPIEMAEYDELVKMMAGGRLPDLSQGEVDLLRRIRKSGNLLRKFMDKEDISVANELVSKGWLEKGTSAEKPHSVMYYVDLKREELDRYQLVEGEGRIKKGDIVRIKNPYPDEDPNRDYVVVQESIEEFGEDDGIDVMALGTGLSFPPISRIRMGDLRVVGNAMADGGETPSYDFTLFAPPQDGRLTAYQFSDPKEALIKAEELDIRSNGGKNYFLRDTFTGRVIADGPALIEAIDGRKPLAGHDLQVDIYAYEPRQYEFSEFMTKERQLSDALVHCDLTRLGKAMVCQAKIDVAVSRGNSADTPDEMNGWQCVENHWRSCLRDCLDGPCVTYKRGGETWDCGCGKSYRKGGLAYGNSHDKGGIPLTVSSTGQDIEIEGGEGVVNKRSMQIGKTYSFEGKRLTPCEIVSRINEMGGGVKFRCDDVKKIIAEDGSFE